MASLPLSVENQARWGFTGFSSTDDIAVSYTADQSLGAKAALVIEDHNVMCSNSRLWQSILKSEQGRYNAHYLSAISGLHY